MAENKDNPSIVANRNKSKLHKIFWEIYTSNTAPGFHEWTGNHYVMSNTDDVASFSPTTITLLNSTYTKIDPKFKESSDETRRVYIRFGLLCLLLENYTFLYDKANAPYFKFNFNYKDLRKDENYCMTFPGMFSADPSICLIPSSTNTFGTTYAYTDVEFISKYPEQFYEPSTDNYVGRIADIFVNLNFITKTLDSLSTQNSKDPSVSLHDLISSTLDGMAKSLGGVNNFEITYDGDDNVIVVRDMNKIKNKPGVTAPPSGIFKAYGVEKNKGSFLTRINLSAEISNNIATQISIGAQAQGNQPTSNSTSLALWNKGLNDRNITEKIIQDQSPSQPSDPPSKTPTDNLREIDKKIKEIIQAGITSQAAIDSLVSINSEYASLLTGILTVAGEMPAAGVIPLNLSLEMDGLSGMKNYQKFNITDEVLPIQYTNVVEFIIKGITHDISNNKWTTKIESIMTPKMITLTAEEKAAANKLIGPSSPPPPPLPPYAPDFVKQQNSNKPLKQIIIDAGYPEGTLAYIFALSIGTKEGWNPKANGGKGSRNFRNNNPGNLDYSNSLKIIDFNVKLENNPYGASRFASFSTAELGVKALVEGKLKNWAKGKMPITAGNQIEIETNKGGKKYTQGLSPTIAQAVYTYAPPSDGNNTEKYINDLLADIKKIKSDTTRNTPLNNFF